MCGHETEDTLHLLQPSSQEYTYTQVLHGLEIGSRGLMLFLRASPIHHVLKPSRSYVWMQGCAWSPNQPHS